jgi:3-dehydroquinate synthase
MTMVIKVRLADSADRSYSILIRQGLYKELPGLLEELVGKRRVFLISDTTVSRLYGDTLLRLIRRHRLDATLVSLPPGERSKNPENLLRLQSALLRGGVQRDSFVVAFGGGVIGDLAGFVAATVLRGIRFIQVPTTLLAQVDSSVGGKVGVDHPLGKNLLGAFHQPSAVYIDPALLQTLSDKEYRNGLAEVVKIAVALDRRFFEYLERNIEPINARDVHTLAFMIEKAVGLKAAVVEADEHETGLRKALNLGHTVGHALEAA